MNRSIVKIGYGITIFMLFHISMRSQSMQWPHGVSKGTQHTYDITPVKHGYIVLKNNDTISGELKVPPSTGFSYCSIIPSGRERTSSNILDYHYREINKVRILDDSIAKNGEDFICLKIKKKEKLYRQLGTLGKAAVYDDRVYTYDNNVSGFKYQNVFEHKYYSLRMMLFVDSNKIKIYDWPLFNKRFNIVLSFINKRYHAHLTKNDFSTIGEMVLFILKKENE